MCANVRIVVARIKNAITVPAECIFSRGKRAVVFVERGGHYRETTVKLGRTNGDYTMITSGVKAGERLSLNDLGNQPDTDDDQARPETNP